MADEIIVLPVTEGGITAAPVVIDTGDDGGEDEWQSQLLETMREGNNLLRTVVQNQDSQRDSLALVPTLILNQTEMTRIVMEQGSRFAEQMGQLTQQALAPPAITIVEETPPANEGEVAPASLETPISESPARRRPRTL